MRQIVVDTETTGLEFSQGHRVVGIGCVELHNRRASGETFHRYINPQRDIDEAALEIHGITAEKLKDEPVFADVADELLEFIRGAELIIHNAPFDVEFLNGEFAHAGRGEGVIEKHCDILDALVMARHKHPGQRNTLDALCKRYAVDNEQRTLHGALLDAEILADVYLAMTGGQAGLFGEDDDLGGGRKRGAAAKVRERVETPLIRASEEERVQHEKWLQLLEKESGVNHDALWRRGESS